jgi:hypothetical protein
MANHYRVSPKFWIKARKRGWSDQQTTLALYLLTCEHRNLEGLYRLPKPYIAADLGWGVRKVEEQLTTVCASGFAVYDEDAQIVLIPKALKHQAPSTENQIKGAIAQLERIPRTSLWDAFRIACASHCPKLADAIDVRWPSDPDEPSRVRVPARAPASSSISSSASKPPQPPRGSRQRDLDQFLEEITAWASLNVPDIPPPIVAGAISNLRAANCPEDDITPDRIRQRVRRSHPHLQEVSAA